MEKREKGFERLSRCLVEVESVNKIFEHFRETFSNSKLGKSIAIRKLFINLPKPWYLILTEGNLLEWTFPLNFVEWLIENIIGYKYLEKFKMRCQKDLFLLSEEKGKPYISVYNFFRNSLINTCEKMGYSEDRIKQIIKFDDFIAKLLIKEGQPELNGSPLVLLTKYVRWINRMEEEALQNNKFTPEEIEKFRSEMRTKIPKGKIDLCDYVERLNSEGVSPKEQIFVNRLATLIRIKYEAAKLGMMSLLHKKIAEGYSPQVWFLGPSRYSYEKLVKGETEPDWKMSLENIERFPWVSFFRTPEFEVFVENGKIHSIIFDPQKITTQEWKKIGGVFSRFRKVLKTKRKRWGEVSGRREILRSIQSFIKEEAQKKKDEDPTKGLYDLLDILKVEVMQRFGIDYDYETLRKKLYSKLSDENKSINSKHSQNK